MTTAAVRQKKTVSVTLADALKREIRHAENLQWKRDNKKALQELNRITDEYALFSDEYRTF